MTEIVLAVVVVTVAFAVDRHRSTSWKERDVLYELSRPLNDPFHVTIPDAVRYALLDHCDCGCPDPRNEGHTGNCTAVLMQIKCTPPTEEDR
jgi:hypothetical protein